MPARRFVNAISLSRIAIALLFVLCFQRDILLFWISVALCLFALATDLLDGFLARRLKLASIIDEQFQLFSGAGYRHLNPL
jgi:phosphatidylglycerophosphate synthase